MVFVKNMVFCLVIIASNFMTLCASDLSSVHIVALENGDLVKKAPFRSRVNIFSNDLVEEDIESKKHGLYVSSVLVGEKSNLPSKKNITLVPTVDYFVLYLKEQKHEDLVIFNWSGSIGNPGLPEEILDEYNELQSYFQKILLADLIDFNQCVKEYIANFNNIIQQLNDRPDNHLTPVIKFAKECLETAQKEPTILQSNKNNWLSKFAEKLNYLKEESETKSHDVFKQMKSSVLKSLKEHDNTLIVWALGNDGNNCDQSPFWQELLNDESILSHTVLIYGHTRLSATNRHRDSNYTTKYINHTFGKPYTTSVWDDEEAKYISVDGTSFSAPLVTIDAFQVAQDIFNKTGKAANYLEIKDVLTKKNQH